MPLSSDIKFQKTLALAASASNAFEAEAAELAARRLMAQYDIDPTDIPNRSLYNRTNFVDNALLKKLRDEWREAHPVVPTVRKVKQSQAKEISVIEFDIAGFRKIAKKNSKHNHYSEPRDEARVEMLRQLLNSGKTRSELFLEHGFKGGEISGIIRDYCGQKSAHPRFRRNPRWVAMPDGGRVIYMLSMKETASHGETTHPEVIDGASVAQSDQDAGQDSQSRDDGDAMSPGT